MKHLLNWSRWDQTASQRLKFIRVPRSYDLCCHNSTHKELTGLKGSLLMSPNNSELCKATHTPAWLLPPRGITYMLRFGSRTVTTGRGTERGNGRPRSLLPNHPTGTLGDRQKSQEGQRRGQALAGTEEAFHARSRCTRSLRPVLTPEGGFWRTQSPSLRVVMGERADHDGPHPQHWTAGSPGFGGHRLCMVGRSEHRPGSNHGSAN